MAARSVQDQREREALKSLLRQIRVEAGLRQVDVAERLEVPQSYVSNYESGERRLDILELRRLCKVLGISSAEFMNRLDLAIEGKRRGGTAQHGVVAAYNDCCS